MKKPSHIGPVVGHAAHKNHLHRIKAWTTIFSCAWRLLRRATGDDAYERYLAHRHEHHAQDGGQPLSRKAFYRAELERKWNGLRRCC